MHVRFEFTVPALGWLPHLARRSLGALLLLTFVGSLVIPVALAINSAYFSDVNTAAVGGLDEAVKAIDNLKDRAVTTGCVPSSDPLVAKFCPGDPIPRWQMALFFARGLDFDLAKTKGAYAAFDGGRSTTGPGSTPAPTAGLYVVGGTAKDGLLAEAGTGGRAAVFTGTVHTTLDFTKAYTAGTANRADPIAYAVISAAGAVQSGTPNVSSTWNAGQKWYEITIAGESYFYLNYVAVVTPFFATAQPALRVGTGSVNNNLLVAFFDQAGNQVQAPVGFQLVVYKP